MRTLATSLNALLAGAFLSVAIGIADQFFNFSEMEIGIAGLYVTLLGIVILIPLIAIFVIGKENIYLRGANWLSSEYWEYPSGSKIRLMYFTAGAFFSGVSLSLIISLI